MSSWDYPQEVHAISASGNAHPASYPTPELSYSPPQSPGGGDQDDNDLVDLPASSSAGGKGKGKSGSRRRKSNADEPSSVLSRFNILATPLANKKNAECQVVVYHAGKAPEPCGAWLTYASKDGPRSLVRHLERFHAGEYELYLKQRNTRRSQDKGKDTPSKSAKRKASDSHAGGGSKRPAAKEGGSTIQVVFSCMTRSRRCAPDMNCFQCDPLLSWKYRYKLSIVFHLKLPQVREYLYRSSEMKDLYFFHTTTSTVPPSSAEKKRHPGVRVVYARQAPPPKLTRAAAAAAAEAVTFPLLLQSLAKPIGDAA